MLANMQVEVLANMQVEVLANMQVEVLANRWRCWLTGGGAG